MIPAALRNADGTPMSAGLPENIEFFELTCMDSAEAGQDGAGWGEAGRGEAGRDGAGQDGAGRGEAGRGEAFAAVAPLLWLAAGAAGPRVEAEAPAFALPAGGRYGVLFSAAHRAGFAAALQQRPEVTHAFVVAASAGEYQQVVAALPPRVRVFPLAVGYLSSFTINVPDTS